MEDFKILVIVSLSLSLSLSLWFCSSRFSSSNENATTMMEEEYWFKTSSSSRIPCLRAICRNIQKLLLPEYRRKRTLVLHHFLLARLMTMKPIFSSSLRFSPAFSLKRRRRRRRCRRWRRRLLVVLFVYYPLGGHTLGIFWNLLLATFLLGLRGALIHRKSTFSGIPIERSFGKNVEIKCRSPQKKLCGDIKSWYCIQKGGKVDRHAQEAMKYSMKKCQVC